MELYDWPRVVRDLVLWADGWLLIENVSAFILKTCVLILTVLPRSNGGGISGDLQRVEMSFGEAPTA